MILELRRQAEYHLAAVIMIFAFTLTGCTALPGQGPMSSDLSNSQSQHKQARNYAVVRLDAVTASLLKAYPFGIIADGFRTRLGQKRATTIGVGDNLVVHIWEAAPDGLFSTVEKKQTTLQMVVDESGMVFIPYTGRLRAVGRSTEDLRQAIQKGLEGKAVEPQVQIIVSDNKSMMLTVVGDVSNPGQYPVPIHGLRLLEAVAQAGGTKKAVFESVATITRGSAIASVRMEDVISNPSNNIWLAPDDDVTLIHQPRTFSAFGAVKASQLVPFPSEKLTLSEALAQVGGLSDRSADAGGVFIFRYEPHGLARQMIGKQADRLPLNELKQVPIIYRLDLNRPESFFLSQSFRMRDKDIIYVASHPTAELGKFLSMIVSPLLGVTKAAEGIGN